ncbi:MAG: tetratricopeptide repeat protein [Cryomorphaceae bacterium]|nr:tetratricopeptide repeat protein [Cryomorphaceae bacterium]
MKKSTLIITVGIAICLIIGLLLLRANRYPVIDAQNNEEQVENRLDAKVEEALKLLQSGDAPPMVAIGMIKEVLEEDPNHYSALLSLGLMSLQTGQYEKAVERFEVLLQQDDHSPRVLDAAANAYLGVGDTAEALVQFRKMLSLDLDQEVRDELEKTVTSLEKNP